MLSSSSIYSTTPIGTNNGVSTTHAQTEKNPVKDGLLSNICMWYQWGALEQSQRAQYVKDFRAKPDYTYTDLTDEEKKQFDSILDQWVQDPEPLNINCTAGERNIKMVGGKRKNTRSKPRRKNKKSRKANKKSKISRQ